MLLAAVTFTQIVLAVHVVVAIGAFGALVAYPVMAGAAERFDRRSVPVLHRVRKVLGRTLINPGLLFVVAAGIYLASDQHQWHDFFVQWGLGAALVIGALEGAFVIRQSGRLAEMSQRDIDAAGGGEVKWSDEYISARGRADQVNALMAGLVLVTAFLMVVQ